MTGETRLLFFLEKKNEAKEDIERDTAVMQPAFVLVGGHRLEPRGLDQGIAHNAAGSVATTAARQAGRSGHAQTRR